MIVVIELKIKLGHNDDFGIFFSYFSMKPCCETSSNLPLERSFNDVFPYMSSCRVSRNNRELR